MCDKKNVIKDEDLEKVTGGFNNNSNYTFLNTNITLDPTITNPGKIGVQLPGTNIQPSINVNVVTEKK